MKKVDTILTDGIVVTMDEQFNLYEPGAVAVRGDEIVAVGPAANIAAKYKAAETIACEGKVIMPGLVNTHSHVPMTLLRGLADDLRLDVWLMGYMMPVEREFVQPDFCWLGTQLAAAEMIRSGTTCFADMYYYEETVADATAEAGLRAVCGQSILKFPTPDALSYEEGLARTRDFIQRWKGHKLIVPAVAPHAPYTTTPEILRAATDLALEFDIPFHIHVSETAFEVEEMRANEGMSPVYWLQEQGVFRAKTIAAHCVHIDEDEMRILKQHNVGIAHNPSSNLKLASGFAPIAKMLELGLNVGIGTDGVASNNDLDMIEELRLANFIAKGVTRDPTVLPARQTLASATIVGARVLFLDDLIGSLEVGKRADIITLDLNTLHNAPRFYRNEQSIYSQIVYAAKANDVDDVMVDGVWLMRAKQLLTLDEESLKTDADKMARRIDAFLVEREESVLRKLATIGGLAYKETFEVQVKVYMSDAEAKVIEEAIHGSDFAIGKSSQRRQYDTYFIFNDKWTSRIRYREDEILARDCMGPVPEGQINEVTYRLTLTNENKEREFSDSIILSRSRFDALANRSLRFYHEYFQPDAEREVHKERRRYHVRYGGTGFTINFDRILKPKTSPGVFMEIKSRTWSAQDAERKVQLIAQLLKRFNIGEDELIREEYINLTVKNEE
ncbi:MAG TPA: amidohydrolase family protein [Chloroflexi bacterium]|nr:MAG: amidohydrolase [Anaerolineaceae bacterium 4572_5.2]HEY83629.1 amidohydrolase family protein [Chloroflexota bacterium]